MAYSKTIRQKAIRLLLLSLTAMYAVQSRAQIITTMAGHYGANNVVDSIPATVARIVAPQSVVKDAAGNLYIADAGNYRVRKIDLAGTISTFAGSGTMGYGGDGGPATAASLSIVTGMCIDAAGNIYLADAGNNRVRKITPAALITTVAGNGTAGYAGDGASAVLANLTSPSDVAIDISGNLYIADRDNHCIRKVNAGGIISTVAGLGSPGFTGDGSAATLGRLNLPTGIAVDAAGNLYIADQMNGRIRQVNTSGDFSTIAGTGVTGYNGDGVAATVADLHQPAKVSVDGSGNVYISDFANNRIRIVDPSATINTLAGNGTAGFSGDGAAATGAMINHPAGLYPDGSGRLYFADADNNRIRMIDGTGIINTIAGVDRYLGDGGPATSADLLTPSYMCIDKAGNLYFSEPNGYRVRKLTSAGIISTYAGNGINAYTGDGGPATAASLYQPEAVTIDTSGNLFISMFDGVIRKVTPSGTISTFAGNGALGFCGDGSPAISACIGTQGMVMDTTGIMYLSEGGFARIRTINTAGIINTIGGIGSPGYSGDGGAATDAKLAYPLGIQVDDSGNVYVADQNNSAIRKITPSGNISTIAGTGVASFSGDNGPAVIAELHYPSSFTLAKHNSILISDGWNNRIRVVTTDGMINTIAGTGAYGYSGDGGNPLSAELWLPAGITTDTAGNIYFIDAGTYVIRKISGWTPPVPVGIKETQDDHNAIISPNPASAYINIDTKQITTSITVTDIVGRILINKKAYNDRHITLNIEHLAQGTYFIRINENEIVRFVKQ
ncbi:hypothetical protein CJD36_017490 [Flavipsychrobacter stenotrophus]|uniref:Uncharacterized protein n=1 Tax=Flavipsychrobacter stenotrophus TaxID=2077091 RepID=A0A2S7SS35_9BACT|nr:T9SS type A sorting domain-containing protein [Flavipsychrobacter stenotrophus]PQJ09723.1 hypothetical protein CJD36_017490 [Flavipsychrobacter stenotrophus]